MKWRLLLLPFAWLYGIGVALRNLLYNIGVFSTYDPPVKTINVGNLSVGGTGKTPHVEWIANHLLQKKTSVAILSRGYGRETKGYFEVAANDNSIKVGDEPLQYKRKYKDELTVHVSESRKKGVINILENHQVDVILLDDAFQHRAINTGLNIIITPFYQPFFRDYLLPAGDLREHRSGIKRADLVIVSKCPTGITDSEKLRMKNSIKLNSDKVFFSSISYKNMINETGNLDSPLKNVLLVTGIGNATGLYETLDKTHEVTHMCYADHHQFSKKDMLDIEQKFDTFADDNKFILTTEKDYSRLDDLIDKKEPTSPWYFIPIEVRVDEEERLKNILNNYVGTNS